MEGKPVNKPDILIPVLASVLGEDLAKEMVEKVRFNHWLVLHFSILFFLFHLVDFRRCAPAVSRGFVVLMFPSSKGF